MPFVTRFQIIAPLAAALAAGLFIPLSGEGPKAMTAIPFDGSRRLVIITAASADAAAVREQRADLLQHAAGLDERDVVVVLALPGGRVEPVHGPAPDPAELVDLLGRASPATDDRFAVLLVGKDGGVKLRSSRPVSAEDLFALIDTMPMRRREMTR
jgi:hypothetical protein